MTRFLAAALLLSGCMNIGLDSSERPDRPDAKAIDAPKTTKQDAALDTDAPNGGSAAPKINELVFNHTGADTAELIELKGAASTDLSVFTILTIEGDTGAIGVVDVAMQAGTTNAAGYWASSDMADKFENGTVTVLLVSGFTGALAADLDTNDDGTLDSQPWTAIVDAIAINDGGVGDKTYTPAVLMPTHGGGAIAVGGASRIPDGTDTDTPADWVRNDFEGQGILAGVTGTATPGEAINTPTAANQVQP